MSQRSRFLLAGLAVLVATVMGGCGEQPAPPSAGALASSASSNVSDTDVTEHVTMALHQAGALKGGDITVVTSKGDVRLIGMLDSQAQIDEAIRIARAAEGTHTIHDELTIKQ